MIPSPRRIARYYRLYRRTYGRLLSLKLAWFLAMSLLAISASAQVVLTIDGKRIDKATVTITTTGQTQPPVDPPPVQPPTQPPPTGACGPIPPGVVVDTTRLANWAQTGGQTLHNLHHGILAFRFRTDGLASRRGQLATGMASHGLASRSAWISLCPGGPPLPDRSCKTEGRIESVSVRYAQNEANSRVYCPLKLNTTYYLNVRNAATVDAAQSSCAHPNCPFYLIRY